MRKGWKIIIILVIFIAAGAVLFWPRGTAEPWDVLYRNGNGIAVGSVSVDGPLGGGGSQLASGAMMRGGDKFTFSAETVGWPMEVAIYQSLNMQGIIASVTIPSPPGENQYWLVTPVQEGGQWTLGYQLAEKG